MDEKECCRKERRSCEWNVANGVLTVESSRNITMRNGEIRFMTMESILSIC